MAVTITKPASGATLAGFVAVEATYTGKNFEIAAVTVDGKQLASDSAKPIAFSIDTTRVPDGPHTLTVAVRYRTSGGNRRWQKASIPIITEGNDMEVVLSTNKDTSNLGGTVVVTATVTPPGHATPLTDCKFYVDNVLKATDTSYPLTFSWDTTLVADGDHVLKATVVAKRTKTSTPLPVKVTNLAEPPPPPPPPPQDPPVNTILPEITGTATQGLTLLCSVGEWINEPTSHTYQWLRCDAAGANAVAIAGAVLNAHVLTAADVTKTIRCAVIAVNDAGPSAQAISEQTEVVAAIAPAVPVNTVLPIIVGMTTRLQTLTCGTGSWSNSPTSYTYQWKRCDTAGANAVNISGATATSYVLGTADVGKTLRCAVIASNGSGAGIAAVSDATSVVVEPAPPPPVSSFNIPRWTVTLPAGPGVGTNGRNGWWRQYKTPNNTLLNAGSGVTVPHLCTPAPNPRYVSGPRSWEWWVLGSTLIPAGFPNIGRQFVTINPHNSSYDVGPSGMAGVGWGFGSGVSTWLHYFVYGQTAPTEDNDYTFYLNLSPTTLWSIVGSVVRDRRYDFAIRFILGRSDGQLGLAGPGVSGGGIGTHPNGGRGRAWVYVDGALVLDTGDHDTLLRALAPDGKTYTQTSLHRPWDGSYANDGLSATATLQKTASRVGRTLQEALDDGKNGFTLHSEFGEPAGPYTTSLTPFKSSDFKAPTS